MEDILAAWKNCTLCSLHEKRKQIVLGSGNAINPKILAVGEAPGPEEDTNGVPFFGPTGKLLRRTMEQTGIDPEKDCYITNSAICFPTITGKDFRAPTAGEIMACRPRLEAQIKVIAASVKVVLIVGKRALGELLFREDMESGRFDSEAAWNSLKMEKILGWHTLPLEWGFPETTLAYATYHPSYISRLGANVASLPYIQWKKDLKAVADQALHNKLTRPRE
jgi:uracil-DNA glycosylase family 4